MIEAAATVWCRDLRTEPKRPFDVVGVILYRLCGSERAGKRARERASVCETETMHLQRCCRRCWFWHAQFFFWPHDNIVILPIKIRIIDWTFKCTQCQNAIVMLAGRFAHFILESPRFRVPVQTSDEQNRNCCNNYWSPQQTQNRVRLYVVAASIAIPMASSKETNKFCFMCMQYGLQ